MLTRRLVCAALAAAFLPLVPLPVHAGDAGLDGVLSELAPPPSDQALAQIPELGRKLLALRSYVRYGDRIKTRWSWTDEQIAAFKASEAHTVLRAEIAAVNEHFKAANPGYEIYVHGTVRSLDSQISKWNSNKSVGAAAPVLKPRSSKSLLMPTRSSLKSCAPGCAATGRPNGPTWQHPG
jgi:hypothetical protein